MAEKRAEDAASIRLNEMERDDCLLRAWVGRRDALDFLAREIADYNEIVPDHDRMVVRMVYRLVRTAILMFRIDPMIPVEYGEDFRRIAIEIGSDGMDLIADSVRWHGARRWRDDPDVSAEGAAPRTFYGKIAVPGENLEDEYTADLTHETDIVTYKKALEYIWREDNVTGGSARCAASRFASRGEGRPPDSAVRHAGRRTTGENELWPNVRRTSRRNKP